MSKIVYITAKTPFGLQESFVLTEMLALKEDGADLLIIPRDKTIDEPCHKKAEPLFTNAIAMPLINFAIARACLKYMLVEPISFLGIIHKITFKARSIKIALKNIAILPKSIYFTAILSRKSIAHIHAHWASTTSTMTYVISKVTGIPWSFTAHRWDITENNLLLEKCRTASFIRVISKRGLSELSEIINDDALLAKIRVIHMGVDIPEGKKWSSLKPDKFAFLCPANLLPVKGHSYLFEACRILKSKGIKFRCLVAGDGPLENTLKKMVVDLKLDTCIEFLGRISHEELFALYQNSYINAVILSSIRTENDEKEGIPVSLMEAMSYGIPVISTNTGGIPELIGDGSGIMVDEKNPEVIAIAIEKLMKDRTYYNFISEKGKEKIVRDFNVYKISKKLLALYSDIK